MDFKELPLLELFTQLQKAGLSLGIGEYYLLLESLEGGFGVPNRQALCRLCCLLWAKSPAERRIIEHYFAQTVPTPIEPVPIEKSSPKPRFLPYISVGAIALTLSLALFGDRHQLPPKSDPTTPSSPGTVSPSPTDFPANSFIRDVADTTVIVWRRYQGEVFLFGSLLGAGGLILWLAEKHPHIISNLLKKRTRPRNTQKTSVSLVNTPLSVEKDEIEQASSLQGQEFLLRNEYLPITQRQMKQKWRNLRLLARRGKATELDLRATIEQISQQGFLLNPIFVPRRCNQIQLLLLLDWDGSMVPFHRLGQRLSETAASEGKLKSVKKYYFHNCPTEYLYEDPYHQQFKDMANFLKDIDSLGTVALIFSDGGALRGGFNKKRIRATKRFLVQLQQKVHSIVWLNPLPLERWQGTTAGAIARIVPMREVSPQGFQQAMNLLRGYTKL